MNVQTWAALCHEEDADAATALLWWAVEYVRLNGFQVACALNPLDGEGRRISSRLHTWPAEAVFSVLQDLGCGSTACNLDSGGLAAAAATVENALPDRPDLVVLNKFGRAEAQNGGLRSAFLSAASAGIPVLTRIQRSQLPEWQAFCGSMGQVLPPERGALRDWLDACVLANQM